MSDIEFMPVDMSELAIEDVEDCYFALEIVEKAAMLVRTNYPERNVWPLWLMASP